MMQIDQSLVGSESPEETERSAGRELLESETPLTVPRDTLDNLDPRVPGLTILWHPDPGRIGEKLPLSEIGSGRSLALSRLAPSFAAASGEPRPLSVVHISRRPIWLCPGAEPGSLRLERAESGTEMLVEGRRPADHYTFSAAEIESGLVLLLSRRVVLFLHLLDPSTCHVDGSFGLIGRSAAIFGLCRQIGAATDFALPVLLRGETGTGKELVARALHQAGPRRDRPFVAVNMAALPSTLAAAELFGAVRGAYTGSGGRKGLFQAADGGTLFLDEIGEAPLEVQVLLLRALEEGRIRPVGSVESRKVDVRIVAATDTDLEAAIQDQRFRAPLLHRLAGYTLHLPPLRERREDLGLLLVHFLRRELAAIGASYDELVAGEEPLLSAELVARLASSSWPGNVRQLSHVACQLVMLSQSDTMAGARASIGEILARLQPANEPVRDRSRTHRSATASRSPQDRAPRRRAFRKPGDVSDEELRQVLRAHRWKPRSAAAALGVSRATLFRLIDRCPTLRKAAELERPEIDRALAACGGSLTDAAERLEVSLQGLKRRLTALKRQAGSSTPSTPE